MEFRRIVYFLKVAEKLNFTKAAHELFISPQALSKQIQELEQQLDFPLFYRTTTEVHLTAKGLAMQKRFAPLLVEWELAWKETLHEKNIKIAYFNGLPQGDVVAKVIQYYVNAFPQWQPELTGQELSNVRDFILTDSADFAISVCHPDEYWTDCCKLTLFTTPACVILSARHPLAAKFQLTLKDLNEVPLVYLKQKIMHKDSFFGKMNSSHVLYADDNTAVLQNVALGKGAAVLPILDPLFPQTEFRVFPLPQSCAFDFEVNIICKEQHPLKPAILSISKANLF